MVLILALLEKNYSALALHPCYVVNYAMTLIADAFPYLISRFYPLQSVLSFPLVKRVAFRFFCKIAMSNARF